MLSRRRTALLVLLGLAWAGLDETLVHTDDGCVLETHCSACMLQLGTPAVFATAVALPQAERLQEPVASAPVVRYVDAFTRRVLSRGPPRDRTAL